MERFDGTGIESMLRELRPTPQPEFAAELDARVASGFPRRDTRLNRILSLRATPSRRILISAAACAVVAIAIATAVMSTSNPGSTPKISQVHRHGPVQFSETEASPSATEASGASSTFFSAPGPRDIERSARITLLADPEDVADDSAQVFAAVHDAHGIVLRSNTTQGPAGRAGATFGLLIPSARLGDALAAISAIDEVGSRRDATADITAATDAVGEHLADSRARIDSLLTRLASAETESEREAVEAELHYKREQAAAFEEQLSQLHRRTRYSHLSVRIETGDSPASSSGAWGFDDALGSAAHILGVAAGVTLVGLAVLAPIALLIFLAWLAHHAWLRIRRERALS
jgi:Domain of unknown function (DUF4349)